MKIYRWGFEPIKHSTIVVVQDLFLYFVLLKEETIKKKFGIHWKPRLKWEGIKLLSACMEDIWIGAVLNSWDKIMTTFSMQLECFNSQSDKLTFTSWNYWANLPPLWDFMAAIFKNMVKDILDFYRYNE